MKRAVVWAVGLAIVTLQASAQPVIERITTIAPFPRGLAMVDGDLYVLCRGRVRDAGGVTAEVDDQAGTIYRVDPTIAEPVGGDISERVRRNGELFAAPTEPPFRLWRRDASPPESDRETDRPYCTLRFHEPTQSFYLCAFSGIDKAEGGRRSFSKNLTDAVLRYDLRTKSWHEVERHDIEAGGQYPHHAPSLRPPPHGWVNGPDNCLVVGNRLYVAAKDNSVLVQYDLSALVEDPDAGPPPSRVVMNDLTVLRPWNIQRFYGQSALAMHDGYLYIAYRTSSVVLRIRLDEQGDPVRPILAELVARFDPYDPVTRRSPDLTDMAFDSRGRLYIVSAKPARIYRWTPDPDNVFDAREGREAPWLDLSKALGDPRLKSENILIDDRDRLYVTTGDGYSAAYDAYGVMGAVYRVQISD